MNKEELKELQKVELKTVKEILKIFDAHQIRYFMLGGTLLGAIRHKGFIPWDDDIDLGVPRKDYDRFLEVASKELPPHLKAVTFEDEKDAERPIYYCQVKDLNTEIVQHIAKKDYKTNVWIDIFPLDGMPDNPAQRKIHCFRLLYWRMRLQFSMFDENVHLHRKSRPLHEKALIRFYQITKFGSHSKPYDIMKKLDKAMRMYDYDRQNFIINFKGTWKLKEMFPKKVYSEGKMYPFEDIEMRGPENYDYVLSQMYGDYMTPPEDTPDRYEHHSIEINKL